MLILNPSPDPKYAFGRNVVLWRYGVPVRRRERRAFLVILEPMSHVHNGTVIQHRLLAPRVFDPLFNSNLGEASAVLQSSEVLGIGIGPILMAVIPLRENRVPPKVCQGVSPMLNGIRSLLDGGL